MRKILLLIGGLVSIVLSMSGASADVIGSYTFRTDAQNGFSYLNQGYHLRTNVSIHPEICPTEMNRTSLFNGADTVDPSGAKGIDMFGNIGRTFWLSSD